MAAGRGMRMMPLTGTVPKPLVKLNGVTLISKGINFLRNNIPNIHITVGYKGNEVAEHVSELGVNSVFNTEGHGNAWWIYNTLMKDLNEPVLVLTCDNIVDLDISLLSKDYFSFGAPACLVVPVKPVQGLDGDFIFHSSNRVTKLSRTEKSDVYCSGIQILNPAKVNSETKPTDNFYELWNELIAKQKLFSSNIYPSRWTAIDTMEQLNDLSENSE
ncbi:MAG: NTP transferase domain-containing protein [Bacteroidetes bacterium]|nr:NTP transferase domain-containing protein [Bacteroidota bacterium]